jgi:hydroxymethylpyrimidine pyrophosphatase-like HAD family hydrolase
MRENLFQRRRVIAVDVDGTILVEGKANLDAIEWCKNRKRQGYVLFLWSARGKTHAEKVAAAFGIAAIFDVIISKPGYILDDKGWTWINFTKALHPRDIDLSLELSA